MSIEDDYWEVKAELEAELKRNEDLFYENYALKKTIAQLEGSVKQLRCAVRQAQQPGGNDDD